MYLGILLHAAPLAAQDRIPSNCIALAEGPAQVWQADFAEQVGPDSVQIRYVNHSMFLIQAEGGVSAVTDYAGFLGSADFAPSVVTMNNGHSTHWTASPDPAISLVLQGWAEAGVAAEHYIDLGAMLVRNVTTDTRGPSGWREDGNSIFVFEAAGLCIAHLGHLHHEPTPAQYARLGRVDVVMIAVDGGLTLDTPTALRVMEEIRARVVLPMHWFGTDTLGRFLEGMSADFAIDLRGTEALTLSLGTLPDEPTVIVLAPEFLSD